MRKKKKTIENYVNLSVELERIRKKLYCDYDGNFFEKYVKSHEHWKYFLNSVSDIRHIPLTADKICEIHIAFVNVFEKGEAKCSIAYKANSPEYGHETYFQTEDFDVNMLYDIEKHGLAEYNRINTNS